MMSKDEVREIVDENLRELRIALQLQGWFLRLSYGTNIGGRACCTADPKRHEATIAFNPGEFEDEEDVLGALLHELLHIWHAEFDLYRDAVRIALTQEVFDALEPTYENAAEHLVERVVCFFEHTVRTTATKMIATTRRREGKEGGR